MTNDDNNTHQNHYKFICIKCDFKCSNKKDYNRHLSTNKHTIVTHSDAVYPKKYVCLCGKKYTYRQGLSLHKKKCTYDSKDIDKKVIVETDDATDNSGSNFEIDKEMLIKMLLKNQDVMERMMEYIENQEKETNKIIRSVSKEVYLNNDTKSKYLGQS
jgi:hypothetical protein